MEAVFVYGTLKRGERNHGLVAPYLHRVLPGFVEGFRLYHLPWGPHRPYAYPGMVPGEGRVLEEGEEYKRVRVRVETEEGPLEAWAYLYLGGLEGALPLPQGVWKG